MYYVVKLKCYLLIFYILKHKSLNLNQLKFDRFEFCRNLRIFKWFDIGNQSKTTDCKTRSALKF